MDFSKDDLNNIPLYNSFDQDMNNNNSCMNSAFNPAPCRPPVYHNFEDYSNNATNNGYKNIAGNYHEDTTFRNFDDGGCGSYYRRNKDNVVSRHWGNICSEITNYIRQGNICSEMTFCKDESVYRFGDESFIQRHEDKIGEKRTSESEEKEEDLEKNTDVINTDTDHEAAECVEVITNNGLETPSEININSKPSVGMTNTSHNSPAHEENNNNTVSNTKSLDQWLGDGTSECTFSANSATIKLREISLLLAMRRNNMRNRNRNVSRTFSTKSLEEWIDEKKFNSGGIFSNVSSYNEDDARKPFHNWEKYKFVDDMGIDFANISFSEYNRRVLRYFRGERMCHMPEWRLKKHLDILNRRTYRNREDRMKALRGVERLYMCK